MKFSWVEYSVLALVAAVVCFFWVAYFDIMFAALSVILAVKGLFSTKAKYPLVTLIIVSSFLLLLAVFQLIVRVSELGYFPPII